MRLYALTLFVSLACMLGSPAAAKIKYAEGQIWEYRARPSDRGSLLKIQKIDLDPKTDAPIYHLTIIGVYFSIDSGASRAITHVPVARTTLDQSVTRPGPKTVEFPSAEDGIASWHQAKGGVFTIPVAKIVDIVEKELDTHPQQASGQGQQ